MRAQFPLTDGQTVDFGKGPEKIMGEIRPDHSEPIAWTLQGNWYRRSDGEPMTSHRGEVITASEFYKRQREGKA
jgi:hypothetical protein